MNIETVKVYKLSLPFRGDFSHSRKKGLSADNLVVQVTTEKGRIKGYGEGAPRSYVTGESQTGAAKKIEHLLASRHFPWNLENESQIWEFVSGIDSGKKGNAALCAIETALLDLLGKIQNRAVLDFFPKNHYTGHIFYGATIPMAGRERTTEVCRQIKAFGLSPLRIKMGGIYRENKERIETAGKIFGGLSDIRIDINGSWNYELAKRHLDLFLKNGVSVLEQPVEPESDQLPVIARLMKENDIRLMADESACSMEDCVRIADQGFYDLVNVRLSKCGGLTRSLEITDFLRSRGLSFQIGCQLGESGLLSAAGRVMGLLSGDADYWDGSYDNFVLKENLTTSNVSFGPGGEAGPIKGSGLGVEVGRHSLEKLCDLLTVINAP